MAFQRARRRHPLPAAGYALSGGRVQNRLQGSWGTMNSGILSISGQPVAADQSNWRQRLEAWRGLLAACGRKPSRKRVHSLRVATLRIQAELEYELGGSRQGNPAARAARRWNRQAEKLRRALSPVRGADVNLARLDQLRGTFCEKDLDLSRMSRMCNRQVDALEQRLVQLRKAAARELIAEIEARRARLERCGREIEAAFAAEAPRAAGSERSEVRVLIAGLAEEFPELNRERLHEFRKRVKMVRYLAESSTVVDPAAARRVAALKRMQAAAGEWHDLQALAKTAARTFRGRDKERGLAELLETLAAESLQRALETCGRALKLLLQHGARNGPSRVPVSSKLPVRRADPVAASDERKFA